MFQYLKGLEKVIEFEGQITNLEKLKKSHENKSGTITMKIVGSSSTKKVRENTIKDIVTEKIYRIKVRQYMTRPSSPMFDFHAKWNNDKEMPFRIMTGKKLQETKGMVKMELWAEMETELMTVCMKCGRALTNNVSKYFGIGPECGGHNYVNPFKSEEELAEAIAETKQQLLEITWVGWVIKSAIEEETIVREEVV